MTILKLAGYYFLFLSLILLISCDKDTEPTPPPKPIKQDGLWPLNFNNEWNYKRVFYESDGSIESFIEEQVKITDTVTLKGQLYFGNRTTGQFLTNVGENSVRGIGHDSTLTDSFAVIFQRVYNNDTIIWRLEDGTCLNDQSFRGYTGLTSINGYDCLRNEERNMSCSGTVKYRKVYYLKPGVGLVRYEEHVSGPGLPALYLRLSVELLSYKLY